MTEPLVLDMLVDGKKVEARSGERFDVLNPATGEVLGIVTSGIEIRIPRDPTEESTEEGPSIPLPMTYVLPSEVIMPYVNTIKFETKDASGKRRIWR